MIALASPFELKQFKILWLIKKLSITIKQVLIRGKCSKTYFNKALKIA